MTGALVRAIFVGHTCSGAGTTGASIFCRSPVPHVSPGGQDAGGIAVTKVIGLTGGIASGKSAVSYMLATRGALLIDADKLAHEAYAPGNDCYDAVVLAFGNDIVSPDGSIDRKALGAKVFADAEQRRRLEGIVWPWMRERMVERLAALRAQGVPVVVLEAAVLMEAAWEPLVDEVWVVSVHPAAARDRLMSRNGLSAEQADQRISAQLRGVERERRAGVIIDNNGTLEELERRVDAAWQRLQGTAGRDA